MQQAQRSYKKPPSARQLTVEVSEPTAGNALNEATTPQRQKVSAPALIKATAGSTGCYDGSLSPVYLEEPRLCPKGPGDEYWSLPTGDPSVKGPGRASTGLPIDRQAWDARLGTAMEQLLLTRRSDAELVLRLM